MPSPIEQRHALSPADRAIEERHLAERRRLAALAAAAPPPSLAAQRAGYDAMTAATPLVPGMAMARIDEPDAHGWWVRPAGARADRAILFIHGGGFVVGSAAAYRGFASQLAARTGRATFVLDYPLAPEHPAPAAHEAVLAARRWLGAQGISELALAGDSAGGCLALGTLGEPAATAGPRVASVVTMSTCTDLAMTLPSMTDPQTVDPIFGRATIAGFFAPYVGDSDPRDRRISPLYHVPAALPPLLLQVGSDELLLDDSRVYAARAAGRGGEVHLAIYEGLHHVFQRVVELAAARAAFDAAAAFILAH